MPWRGLVAALVAMVVAAGLVWWSRSREATDEGSKSPELFNLTETEMRKIELRRASGEVTVLERGDDPVWRITAPTAYAADREAAQSLVNALAKLNAEQVVEEKVEDFGEFGLREPDFIALVTMKDGALHTVMLGDEVPAAGGYYARRAGDERLFTIASFTRTSLDKSARDLRDKRLLTFDPAALARVALRARGQSVEFGRDSRNNWQIVKPEPLRADGWQVEELIRRLREANLDPEQNEDDARKLAADFGRAAPLAFIEVTSGTDAQSLEVKRTSDNRYLGRSSVVPGVHLITNDTGEGFDKTAADFRTRKLFDFGFAEPARVEFKDEQGARVFAKEDGAWKEGGKAMDTVGVQSLIDRLRDLGAEGFPASGFTAAAIELTVTAGDPATTEKVLIARAGERYIARRDGEAALYELNEEAVKELTQAARDVKEAPAAETKK